MKQSLVKVFLMSLIVGFIFERVMVYFWQYDTLPYFLGVPVAIVFVWGILLTSGYYILNKYERKTKLPLFLDLLLLYVPLIIVAEFIGTNVLNWQINKIYPALIGNFMKAPIIIYVAYYLVSLFFFRFCIPYLKKVDFLES